MQVTFADGSSEDYEDTAFSRGAQGGVYRSRGGQSIVKLFNQITDPAQLDARREQVDQIIGQYNVVGNDPLWAELFSWPDRRVDAPSLGVRMRLVTGLIPLTHYNFPTSFKKLSREQQGWWIGRVAAAIKLARAVRRLADAGLCHSDLSEKNVMVDPLLGLATVIDCDSLVVPGPRGLKAEVLGTPGYMAPELVSGDEISPTVESDRHSLAVLLYQWLLFRHPLDGRLVHDPDQAKDDALRYGKRALYCEHPFDRSNRPANMSKMQLTAGTIENEGRRPGETRIVSALTPLLAQLFHEAFVTQLHNPAGRPLPARWEHALIEMYDRIIPCSNPRCMLKYFAASDVEELRCPLCFAWAEIPGKLPLLRLKVPVPDGNGGIEFEDEDRRFPHFIVGWRERPIFGWHAYRSLKAVPDSTQPPADSDPVAVVRYDDSAGMWLLENRRLPEMSVDAGNDPDVPQWQPVPSGSYIELRDDLRLLLASQDGRCIEVEMRQVYKTDE